jgi:hypothetical protein
MERTTSPRGLVICSRRIYAHSRAGALSVLREGETLSSEPVESFRVEGRRRRVLVFEASHIPRSELPKLRVLYDAAAGVVSVDCDKE